MLPLKMRTAVASIALTALLATPLAAQEKRTLVVSEWGYGADELQEALYKPFEEQFNAKVIIETGNNPDRLNKLQIRGGVDVIFLTDAFSQQGIDAGAFAEIDRSLLPNLADAYDIAKAPQGDNFGPGYTVGRYGIIYDSAKVSAPITSWKDLWREEFKGQVAMPGFNTTSGPMTVIVAGDRAGVDAFENPEAAFASLAELKPNIVKTYNSGSELVNLFSTGEVIVGALQDFAVPAIQAAIPTAKWAPLDEGNFVIFNTINIAAKSENKDLAHAFINFRLDPKVQKDLAIAVGDGVVNKTVELTPEEAKYAAYGPEAISTLRTPDYRKLLDSKEDWAERWNVIFGQ
jgi:putative spermidine/putrescine transport system substrate-binding protein